MSIALLATGGTIACTQTENGLAPTLSASDLLSHLHAPLPCPVITEDIFSMDSSNMQPEEWCVLAREVDRVLQTCDGVVITHGTDTMAYTAAALS
ncbi:MAG: asparaginase [Clostridia bacterium]|nr:asparaginase [Clostridia bacterium]